MIRRVLGFAALFLVLGGGGRCEESSDPERKLQRAILLEFSEGKPSEAERLYRELAGDPKTPEPLKAKARERLAECLKKSGQSPDPVPAAGPGPAQDYDFRACASMMTEKEDALWLLHDDSPRCSIVSLSTLKVEKEIRLERKGIGLVEKNGTVFILLSDVEKVLAFSAANGEELGEIPMPRGREQARLIAAAPGREDPFVYVVGQAPLAGIGAFNTVLHRIGAGDRKVDRTIPLNWRAKQLGHSMHATVSSGGRFLYMAGDFLEVFDLQEDGRSFFDAGSVGEPLLTREEREQRNPRLIGFLQASMEGPSGYACLVGKRPEHRKGVTKETPVCAFFTPDLCRKLEELPGALPAFHPERPLAVAFDGLESDLERNRVLVPAKARIFSLQTWKRVAEIDPLPRIMLSRAHVSDRAGMLWLVQYGRENAQEKARVAGIPAAWSRYADKAPLSLRADSGEARAGRPWKAAPRWTGSALPGVAFRAGSAPSFLKVDPVGGEMSGTPSLEDAGDHPVRLEAWRGEERIWCRDFTLQVRLPFHFFDFRIQAAHWAPGFKSVLLLHADEPVMTEHPVEDLEKVLRSMPLAGPGTDFAVKGGRIHLLARDREFLEVLDVKTGKPLPALPLPAGGPRRQLLAAGIEEDPYLYIPLGYADRDSKPSAPVPSLLRLDTRSGKVDRLGLGLSGSRVWGWPLASAALSPDGRWFSGIEEQGEIHVFDVSLGMRAVSDPPGAWLGSGRAWDGAWPIRPEARRSPVAFFGQAPYPLPVRVLASYGSAPNGPSRLAIQFQSALSGEELLAHEFRMDSPRIIPDLALTALDPSLLILFQSKGTGHPSDEQADGNRRSMAMVLSVDWKGMESRLPVHLRSFPDTAAVAGRPWAYTPILSRALPGEWRLAKSPAGMRIEPATGRVSFSPRLEDIGDHPVRLEMAGEAGDRVIQEFMLQARLPEFARIPPGVYREVQDGPMEMVCDDGAETAALLTISGRLVLVPKEGTAREAAVVELGTAPAGRASAPVSWQTSLTRGSGSRLAFKKGSFYVVPAGSSILYEIDPLRGKVSRQLPLGGNPGGIVPSPAGDFLVLPTDDKRLRTVSLADWKEGKDLGIGSGGFFSAEGDSFYAYYLPPPVLPAWQKPEKIPADLFKDDLRFLRLCADKPAWLTFKRAGTGRWICQDAFWGDAATGFSNGGAGPGPDRIVTAAYVRVDVRLAGDLSCVLGTLFDGSQGDRHNSGFFPSRPIYHPALEEAFWPIPGLLALRASCRRLPEAPAPRDRIRWIPSGKGAWLRAEELEAAFWTGPETRAGDGTPPPLAAVVPGRPAYLVAPDRGRILALELPAPQPASAPHPRVVSEPPLTYRPGTAYAYRVKLADAGGASLYLREGPEGMKLDESSGELAWTAPQMKEGKEKQDPKLYRVSIHVVRDGGPVAAQSFVLRPEE